MAEGGDEMVQLKAELEAMKATLQKEREEREKASVSSSTASATKQIYVAAGRRLKRFHGAPEKPGDQSVREWVRDVRGQLAARQLNSKDSCSFIIDHLGGKARQEILGRGHAVSCNPEAIFSTLLKVFGDGDTLPQLQQKFFSTAKGQGKISCHSLCSWSNFSTASSDLTAPSRQQGRKP